MTPFPSRSRLDVLLLGLLAGVDGLRRRARPAASATSTVTDDRGGASPTVVELEPLLLEAKLSAPRLRRVR